MIRLNEFVEKLRAHHDTLIVKATYLDEQILFEGSVEEYRKSPLSENYVVKVISYDYGYIVEVEETDNYLPLTDCAEDDIRLICGNCEKNYMCDLSSCKEILKKRVNYLESMLNLP